MRSESSALSLHHIKTTVFTVVLVLPCISEPAERTGIGLCQQPFDSPLGVKKRLKIISRLVLPCISELAERSGIGMTERRPSISSRDSKSRHVCVCFLVLPCISELAECSGIGTTERRPSIPSRDSKSRHVCVCFLVLPTGIEPITNP